MRKATITFRGQPQTVTIHRDPDDGSEFFNFQAVPALGICYGGGDDAAHYGISNPDGPGTVYVSRERLGVILGDVADEFAEAAQAVVKTLQPAEPSAFAYMGTVLYQSAPRKIGKHEWRVTVYRSLYHDNRAMLGYEWRREYTPALGGEWWRRDTDWPRYNHNDGQFAGLPKTLAKLYQDEHPKFARHLQRAA